MGFIRPWQYLGNGGGLEALAFQAPSLQSPLHHGLPLATGRAPKRPIGFAVHLGTVFGHVTDPLKKSFVVGRVSLIRPGPVPGVLGEMNQRGMFFYVVQFQGTTPRLTCHDEQARACMLVRWIGLEVTWRIERILVEHQYQVVMSLLTFLPVLSDPDIEQGGVMHALALGLFFLALAVCLELGFERANEAGNGHGICCQFLVGEVQVDTHRHEPGVSRKRQVDSVLTALQVVGVMPFARQ